MCESMSLTIVKRLCSYYHHLKTESMLYWKLSDWVGGGILLRDSDHLHKNAVLRLIPL